MIQEISYSSLLSIMTSSGGDSDQLEKVLGILGLSMDM